MDTERDIIHLNIADFAVAVERCIDLRLRGRPVVIAPEGAARAAVFDMSDEAFKAGVRKGMALAKARRLCKDVIILPPQTARYEQAMGEVLRRVMPHAPLVELTDTNGHLFLDVSGTLRLFGPACDVAWRLRRTIRKELGLDPIWGLATNKLVAKIATRVVKPTGEYWVEAGQEEAFLAPLALDLLPGLGEDELRQCRDFRLSSIGQLAGWKHTQLVTAFGTKAQSLYEAVRGIDQTPVLVPGQTAVAIQAEHAFGNDTNDPELVQVALYALCETTGAALRARQRSARALHLRLTYTDAVVAEGNLRLQQAVALDQALYRAALSLLSNIWQRRIRLRFLQLRCDHVCQTPAQMELFPSAAQRCDHLQQTLDAIRGRFGRASIGLGRNVHCGLL